MKTDPNHKVNETYERWANDMTDMDDLRKSIEEAEWRIGASENKFKNQRIVDRLQSGEMSKVLEIMLLAERDYYQTAQSDLGLEMAYARGVLQEIIKEIENG